MAEVEISKVNHDQLKKIVKRSFGRGYSLFIWGPPGIGKSYIVKEASKELAEENGLEFLEYPKYVANDKKAFGFCDLRLLTIEPSEIRGIVFPNSSKEKATWLVPDFLPNQNVEKGVLFLDELNLAPPIIQGAAYQLILDRRIGKYELPEGWMVVGAGNREEDRSNVVPMAKALQNRFLHLELKVPTVEEWINGFASKVGVDLRVIGFLSWKRSIFVDVPIASIKDPRFPTPRSWYFASLAIKGVENEDPLLLHYVGMAVGYGTAAEFISFLRAGWKVKLEDLFKNPSGFWDLGQDVRYSVLTRLANGFNENKTKEEFKKICQFSIDITEDKRAQEEFSIVLLRMLITTDKKLTSKYFIETGYGEKVAKRFSDLIL
jgi:hypothetical protein